MNISVMYKIYHRSCDFSTRLHGSAPTGGWIAEEGRVLRRVRNRSVLCTRLLRRRSKARDYPQAATAG